MRSAGGVDEIGQNPARLRGKSEIKGEVEGEGGDAREDAKIEEIFEALPAPAAFASAFKGVGRGDEGGGGENIPRI